MTPDRDRSASPRRRLPISGRESTIKKAVSAILVAVSVIGMMPICLCLPGLLGTSLLMEADKRIGLWRISVRTGIPADWDALERKVDSSLLRGMTEGEAMAQLEGLGAWAIGRRDSGYDVWVGLLPSSILKVGAHFSLAGQLKRAWIIRPPS